VGQRGAQETDPPSPLPPVPPRLTLGGTDVYTAPGRADVTYCAQGFSTNPMRIVGGKQGHPVTVNTDVCGSRVERVDGQRPWRVPQCTSRLARTFPS